MRHLEIALGVEEGDGSTALMEAVVSDDSSCRGAGYLYAAGLTFGGSTLKGVVCDVNIMITLNGRPSGGVILIGV